MGIEYNEDPLVLLPLEVMIRPLELRFKYHFDSDRPTNRLDKVRWLNSETRLAELTNLARILPSACYWIAQRI